MITILLQHAMVFATCLCCFYLLGHFFLLYSKRLILSGFFTNLFVKTLCGAVITVTLCSLFFTEGNTVNLLWLLMLPLIFNKKIELTSNDISGAEAKKFSGLQLLATTCAALLPFLYFAFVFLQDKTFPYRAVHDDLVYYAGISENLVQSGLENRWLSVLHFQKSQLMAEPYHYFELWLNGLLTKLSGLPATACLTLIIFPLFFCFSIFGILALMENFKLNRSKFLLAIFIFLVATGNFFEGFTIQDSVYLAESPLQTFAEKTLVLYPFLIFILLLLKLNIQRQALLSLCLLPLLNPLTLPIVALITIVFSVALKKWKWLIAIGLCFFSILLYYFINQVLAETNISNHLQANLPPLNWKGEIIESLLLIPKLLVPFLLSNFLLLSLSLIAILRDWRQAKEIATLVVVLMIFSLLIVPVFRQFADFQQFFSTATVFCRALNIYLILIFLQENRFSKTLSISAIATILAFGILAIYQAFQTQGRIQQLAAVNPKYLNNLKLVSQRLKKGAVIGLYGQLPFPDDYISSEGYSGLWPFAFTNANPFPIRLDKDVPSIDQIASLNGIAHGYLKMLQPGQKEFLHANSVSDENILTEKLIKREQIRAVLADNSFLLNSNLTALVDTVFEGPKKGSWFFLLK